MNHTFFFYSKILTIFVVAGGLCSCCGVADRYDDPIILPEMNSSGVKIFVNKQEKQDNKK